MNLNSGRQFAIEIHPTDWRFPQEKTWIAGWFRPAAGQIITDIRARIHHRVILGLCGLPHPAFPENNPGLPGPAGSSFSFLLSPQRGATLLRLEARDQSGRWTEFFRTPISSDPNAPAPAPAPGISASLGPLITALLRQRLRTPRRTWDELADEIVSAFVSEPLDAHPSAPFVGALEEPHATGRLRHGCIPVTGWLVHPTDKITRLSVVIDPLPAIDLPHGQARHDITGAFPALDGHHHSAFAGAIALPLGLATPVLLKIFAQLASGDRHLVYARRFTPQLHGDTGEMPLLISSWDFLHAIWTLYRAAGRHSLSRAGMIGAARKIWAAYQSMPAHRPENLWPRENRPLAPVSSTPLPPVPTLTLIDPADDMQMHDTAQYFREGRDALTLVQSAVAQAGGLRVGSVLDLPSGFGRVGRWFRTAYPDATLSVCDIQEAGVAFCRQHLAADGVPAKPDGSHWAALPGPYDVIWCGSLLTHFDRNQWVDHLRRFCARLSPRGVLVFTSHGLLSLEHLRSGEKNYGLSPESVAQLCRATVADGFGYVDYAETPGYGISVAQAGWIHELINRETELEVLAIHPAAWGQHQDMIVCHRRR